MSSCANTFFPRFFNSITEIVTLTLQHLEEKQTYRIKENRCFNCRKKNYTAYDCLKKDKIAVISENVSKNSNS